MCRAQVSTPVFGYAPEGLGVRAMRGLPAAGFLDETLRPGRQLAMVQVSPRQDYILAVDASTGEVVTFAPGAVAQVVAGAVANPDAILLSPRGSSAALLFASINKVQIVSGLPASPSLREIDISAVPTASAMAVGDDGSFAYGSYLFDRTGSMSMISVSDPILALAFLNAPDAIAVATANSVSIVQSGAAQSIAADFSNAHITGFAMTVDNTRAVVAMSSGIVTMVDFAANSAVRFDCECTPQGVTGIGGSYFRLTNPNLSGAKLFDAAAARVLSVPMALNNALPPRRPSPRLGAPRATAPLPAVTIGLPTTSGPLQQPNMTISLATPYSGGVDVTGTATLTFASSVGGDDQTVQFTTGGRTVNFTIPTGTTTANFSGKSSVGVITGTLAGTITVTLSFTASGTNITPSPAPSAAITIATTVPFIQTVQFTNATTTGFNVVVTGFSSTHDMTSGLFHFAPSSNASLSTPDVTVQLGVAFSLWYTNTASNATGSEFTLTVPFFTQGNGNDVVAVTVTLTNSKGSSNPVSDQ